MGLSGRWGPPWVRSLAQVGPRRISFEPSECQRAWILQTHGLRRTPGGWPLFGLVSLGSSAQAMEVVPEPRQVGEAPPNRTAQEWSPGDCQTIEAILQNPADLNLEGHTLSSEIRHHMAIRNVINMLWVLATSVDSLLRRHSPQQAVFKSHKVLVNCVIGNLPSPLRSKL